MFMARMSHQECSGFLVFNLTARLCSTSQLDFSLLCSDGSS